MSIEAIAWAFKKVRLDDSTTKLVLLAVCNYANDDNESWPFIKTICNITGLSRRTVQAHLRKLEDIKILTRLGQHRPDGSDTSAKYLIDLGWGAADAPPVSDARVGATNARGSAQEPREGGAPNAHLIEPSSNHQFEPSFNLTPSLSFGTASDDVIEATLVSKKETAEQFFDKEFWPNYPKRFGGNPKEPARKKIVALIEKGENPKEILAGVMRLFAGLERTGKVGTEFVPMALTWINRKGWRDDPLPTGTGKAQGEKSFFEVAEDLWNGAHVERTDH